MIIDFHKLNTPGLPSRKHKSFLETKMWLTMLKNFRVVITIALEMVVEEVRRVLCMKLVLQFMLHVRLADEAIRVHIWFCSVASSS